VARTGRAPRSFNNGAGGVEIVLELAAEGERLLGRLGRLGAFEEQRNLAAVVAERCCKLVDDAVAPPVDAKRQPAEVAVSSARMKG